MKSSYTISNRISGNPKMNGTILFVMEEGKLLPSVICSTIGYNICIFSFYHSTSVSLGDSVIIFGGYDHHEGRQNLKNIGKVIISNRKSLIRAF